MLRACVRAHVCARACAWIARTLTVLFLVRKGCLAGGGHGGTQVPFTATPSVPTVQHVTLLSAASPGNNGNRRVYTQMHMLFLREAPGSPASLRTQTAFQLCTWGHFIQRPRPQNHRGGKSGALRRLGEGQVLPVAAGTGRRHLLDVVPVGTATEVRVH